MSSPLLKFPALFCSTIFLLMGIGLFTTYVALYLDKNDISSAWAGGMVASHYIGMILGAKLGNVMISRIGHIRTYVTCAAMSTIMALLHIFVFKPELWLILRFILGMSMMGLFIVIESWIHEQVENRQRGIIMASYMVASSLGLVCGQQLIRYFPNLDFKPVLLVAICFCISLIPIAMTRRMHPAPLLSAPMEIRYFFRHIPRPLAAVLVSGVFAGSVYGLAPIYASQSGLNTVQVSSFMTIAMIAGAVAQWPMSKISDYISRAKLIQYNALIYGIVLIPLWGFLTLSYTTLLIFSFLIGTFTFTFYSLTISFANDSIDQSKRVALSALLLAVYSVGASLGPLVIGMAMELNIGAMFVLISASSIMLSAWLFFTGKKDHLSTLPEDKEEAIKITETN